MKILFLTRLFYPHIGGVEKHVYYLSKELLRKDHAITVVAERHNAVLPLSETFEGIAILRIPMPKSQSLKKFSIWWWFLHPLQTVRDADVVHCHDVFFWFLPFRLLFPKKPVYTTFHGYESYPIRFQAIVVRKLSEFLSFATVCIGDFMKKWYGAKPDVVLYGGVELPKVQKKPKFPNAAVFVGRLDEQTGILDYCSAAVRIQKDNPSFVLMVYGEGQLQKLLSREIQYKGVTKSTQNTLQEYQFAFVSRYLAILEAMSVKRLVFALYNNPLKKDYLLLSPFASLIVSVKNAEELSERVVYFLEHPETEQELVENAYEWVKRHTWSKVSEAYLRLWGSV